MAAASTSSSADFPTIGDLRDFDRQSGNALERLLFNHRRWVLLACALITVALAWAAMGLRLNASFAKTIPTHHPYVVNFLNFEKDLKGLSNVVRLTVEAQGEGDIFNAGYVETLRQINSRALMVTYDDYDR